MRQSLSKAAIIGTLMMLLQGCSALRIGYGQGPQLGWWWLDGWLDLSSEQTPRAKAAIAQWFDWHRATQLGDTAALLSALADDVAAPVTGAQVCRWQQRIRDRLDPAFERAYAQVADLVPALGDAQIRHLERRYAKKNVEWRRDHLQPDPEERRQASADRVAEQAETLYGRLDDAQRRLIAAGIKASPFDGAAWYAEREHRQRDVVQTLRQLIAERADRDHVVAALRGLVDRAERSPDPAYRALQARLADYSCSFAAQIHNATTPAQRRSARERLQGWADDLRALAAAPG